MLRRLLEVSEVELARLSHAIQTFGIESDVKVHVLYLSLVNDWLILRLHDFTWRSCTRGEDELPSLMRAGVFMGRDV